MFRNTRFPVRNASPSTTNAIAVNIKQKTYGYGLAGFGAGSLGLEATIDVYSKDGKCTSLFFPQHISGKEGFCCVCVAYEINLVNNILFFLICGCIYTIYHFLLTLDIQKIYFYLYWVMA